VSFFFLFLRVSSGFLTDDFFFFIEKTEEEGGLTKLLRKDGRKAAGPRLEDRGGNACSNRMGYLQFLPTITSVTTTFP
jgi:hypothetical protein